MTAAFLDVFKAALESGRFGDLADAYAADATFEGYLPGELREARGPRAIVAQLERELGPAPAVLSWNVLRSNAVRLEVERGQPSEHLRQVHKFAFDADGLVASHWAYPEPLDTEGEGLSGARLRRVERADGSAVFEKRISPSHDWLMRATHDVGREAFLWHKGPLRSLPDGLEYPIISAEREGDGWLVTTRDITEQLVPEEPSFAQWDMVVRALDSLHDRFRARPPSGLCSIQDRLAVFSEATALREIGGSDWFPKASLHGWRVLPAKLPDDVRGPLLELARQPRPLLAALEAAEPTMIHGDPRRENLGLSDGRVIALDWALGACAPAELDYAWIAGNIGGRGDGPDTFLELVRDVLGPRHDERRLRIALLFQALMDLPSVAYWRATAGAELVDEADAQLTWLIARAREGLAALASERIVSIPD